MNSTGAGALNCLSVEKTVHYCVIMDKKGRNFVRSSIQYLDSP